MTNSQIVSSWEFIALVDRLKTEGCWIHRLKVLALNRGYEVEWLSPDQARKLQPLAACNPGKGHNHSIPDTAPVFRSFDTTPDQGSLDF